MDEIEKVLKKASDKDRVRLLKILEQLDRGELTDFKIKRLAGSSFFRIRVGDFRIVFSQDKVTKQITVESIRRRNERTYR